MDVLFCLLCVVQFLRRADHSLRAVLQAVFVCVCVYLCLIECGLETSTMRWPWFDVGCCDIGKNCCKCLLIDWEILYLANTSGRGVNLWGICESLKNEKGLVLNYIHSKNEKGSVTSVTSTATLIILFLLRLILLIIHLLLLILLTMIKC